MTTIFNSLRKHLLSFIHIQFFISLVSLPVLVAWGLPFSYATTPGNLFFGPFLTVFLLCSSLIFFTELLHIPNIWLINILEKITDIWMWFLQKGSSSWMQGFSIALLPLTLCIALLCFIVLQHKTWGTKKISSLLFSLFFLCIIISQKWHIPIKELTVICSKKHLIAMHSHNGLIIKDYGALSEKQNSKTWVSYTLLTQLTKAFGNTSIDALYLNNFTKRSYEALITLHQETKINTLAFSYQTKASFETHKNFIDKGIITKTHFKV